MHLPAKYLVANNEGAESRIALTNSNSISTSPISLAALRRERKKVVTALLRPGIPGEARGRRQGSKGRRGMLARVASWHKYKER